MGPINLGKFTSVLEEERSQIVRTSLARRLVRELRDLVELGGITHEQIAEALHVIGAALEVQS